MPPTETVRSTSREKGALGLAAPRGVDCLVALLALAAALALLRLEAVLSIADLYLGGWDRDAGLYVWLAEAAPRALAPSSFFETGAFYPYGRSLAWSDNFILPALIIQGLRLAGLTQAASYNVVLLLGPLLAGYFSFLCAFALCGRFGASLFAGLAAVASPYLGGHLGHPQLQFALWLPLSLLLYLRYLDRERARDALLLGLTTLLAFLTTVNYAVIALFALAVLTLFLMALRPALFEPRRLTKLGLFFALGAAPLTPFVAPYLEVRATFGERAIYEAYYFSASALSWLSAPPWSLLYSFTSSLTHSEAHLLVPLSVLLPCAGAFLFITPARRERTLALFLFAVAFAGASRLWPGPVPRYVAAGSSWLCVAALFAGSARTRRDSACLLPIALSSAAISIALVSLGPLGNPEKGEAAAGVYRLAYELFPGLPSIRAVGRIGFAAHVFAWQLAALFLAAKARPITVALLSICVVIEGLLSAYPLERAIPAPEAITALCGMPGDSAAIALPFSGELSKDGRVGSWSEFAKLNVRYMNWTAGCPSHPLVNGYSGQRSKTMLDLPAELRGFPDRRSVAALGELAGLRYVAFVPDTAESAAEIVRRAETLGIRPVSRGGDGSALLELPEIELKSPHTLYVPPGARVLTLVFRSEGRTTVTLRLVEPNSERVARSIEREIDGRTKVELRLEEPLLGVRPQRVAIAASLPVVLEWSAVN